VRGKGGGVGSEVAGMAGKYNGATTEPLRQCLKTKLVMLFI